MWHAGFVIFALSSGVYLNLLNHWKAESWLHVWKIILLWSITHSILQYFMESHDVMRFSGIWPTVAVCVFWCQIKNEYTFQKAVVKSLQLHSSFDRFLVQKKVTYEKASRRPTDVRQYEHFRFSQGEKILQSCLTVCKNFYKFVHGRPCTLLPLSIHTAGHVPNTSPKRGDWECKYGKYKYKSFEIGNGQQFFRG